MRLEKLIGAQRMVLINVDALDSLTTLVTSGVGVVPGLLLLPLIFYPRGKHWNPLYTPLPACACSSRLLPASMGRLDGEAWPLLFPMATAQLCVKVGKCALKLETQAARFRMAPHGRPCPFPRSSALSHTE